MRPRSSIHRPKHTTPKHLVMSMHKSPVMEPPLPDLFARRCASNQDHFLLADEPWTLELTNPLAVLLKD